MAPKKQQPYDEFYYVDCAINGAHNRNNVCQFDDLPATIDTVDAYTTLFLFREEYKQHVEAVGSVRGADKFAVWSPFVWFDIDAGELEQATLNMQTLVRGLQSMQIEEHIVIFFSGAKGYHVGIDSRVFGLSPSVDMPEQMRIICTQLASLFGVEIDTCIYNHNRLWRIPYTIHSKTQCRKIGLSISQALQLSTSQIVQLAEALPKVKTCSYVISHAKIVEPTLTRFVDEAKTGKAQKSSTWTAPVLAGRQLQIVTGALEWLFTQPVTKCRDNDAMLRASECRKVGIKQDRCLELLITWNDLNPDPLPKKDLRRIAKSAYGSITYDYTTNTASLRIAREHSEKAINTLTTIPATASEEPERRPRTLTELLAMGEDFLSPPEEVGDWLSWRQYITLLAGDPKTSGKSTLCTWEAVSALRKGYRVLWISPDEVRKDIVFRFVEAGVEQYGKQLMIAGDGDVPKGWPELKLWVTEQQPDLVILDSIHSLYPLLDAKGKVPDSSETAQWHLLTSALRPLATEGNMAVIWIHHINKGDGKVSGSVGINAAVDVIAFLTVLGNGTKRKLLLAGRRISTEIHLKYYGTKKGYEKMAIKFDKEYNDEPELSPLEVMRLWVFAWLNERISTTTVFLSTEIRTAYRTDQQSDPDASHHMSITLKRFIDDGIIRETGQKVKGAKQYLIVDTAALGEDDA